MNAPITETAQATRETTAAPAGSPARRPVGEDDIAQLVWIADPQIAPDGTRAAFTRVHVDREADDYRTAIWLADVAGGNARALTFGPKDRQPRWSPDGRTLAFVRTPEGKTDSELWLLPMAGGEARMLATLAGGVSSPAWSPDGTRLAFTSGFNPALDEPKKDKPKHEPGRVVTRPVFRENDSGFIDFDHRDHVWVVEAGVAEAGTLTAAGAAAPATPSANGTAGKPRALTCGRFAESAPRWSADGRRVLFLSDRRDEPWFGSDENVLYAVAADLAEPTAGDALEVVVDPKGGIYTWTEGPRGAVALASTVTPPKPNSYDKPTLLLAPGPGAAVKDLGAPHPMVFGETVGADQHPPRGGGSIPLAFTDNGAAVLVQVCHEGASYLARVDAATGELKLLTPPRRDLISGTAAAGGRHWALVLGSSDTPGDLCHFDAATGALTTLYAPNDALLQGLALGETEEFWCDAFDGRRLQGWIVKPPGFDPAKKYPMVLEIHGGPHTAYGCGFYHEFHHLAGAGYVVLFTNPRGSTSYGAEFANVIQYKYPGDDVLDLLSCVDTLLARGYVDEKRMGITGGSGGGLLTNWIIAHTHRFAAAVTQRCVSDWASMYYSSDFALFSTHWFKKPPFEDPAEYAERSPATYASRIETPLMVIHSEDDWRTPIHEGEVMFRALKQQKKTVVMVRFPGESHELSRSGMPSRRAQNQHHIRSWFDKYLLGKAVTEYDG
jgi:dipeptidyl aminopeptidase/acylaminoacyl peptidase